MFPSQTSSNTAPEAPRTYPSTSCRYSVCKNSVKFENEDGCSCATAAACRSENEPAAVSRKYEEPCGCGRAKIAMPTGRLRQRAGLVCTGVVLLLVGLAVFEFKQFQSRSRRAAFTPPTVTSLRPPDRSGNGTHLHVLRVETTRGHPAINAFVGPTRSGIHRSQNAPGGAKGQVPPTPEMISFEPLEGQGRPSRARSGVVETGVTLSPKEAKNRKRTFAVEEGNPVYRRGFPGSFPEPVEGVGSSRQGQVNPRQEVPRLEEAQHQGRPLPSFHGRHRLQEGSSSNWRHRGRALGGRQDTFGHSIVEDLSHLSEGSPRDAASKRSHRKPNTKSQIFPPPPPSSPSRPIPQFPANSYRPGAPYASPRGTQHPYPKSHLSPAEYLDDLTGTEDQYSNPLSRHPTAQGHRQGRPLESHSRKMGHFPEARSHRRPTLQEELSEHIVPGNGETSRHTQLDPVEGEIVEERPTVPSKTDILKIASGDIGSGTPVRKLLKTMNISYTRLLVILRKKGLSTEDLIESFDKGLTLQEIQSYLEEPSFQKESQPPRSYPIEDPSLVKDSTVSQVPAWDEETFEFDDEERSVDELLFLDDEERIESLPADTFDYKESLEPPQRGRKHRKGKNKNKKRNGRKGRKGNKNKHRGRHQKESHLAGPTTSTTTPLPAHTTEVGPEPSSPPLTTTTTPSTSTEDIDVSTAFTSSTSTTTSSAVFQDGHLSHTTTPKPETTSSTLSSDEVTTTTTTATSEREGSSTTNAPTLASEGEEDMSSVVAVVVEEVLPDAKNQPEFYEPTQDELDEVEAVVSETVIEGPKEEYVFPIRGILILSGVMGAMAMFTLVVLVFYAIVKCSKRAPVNNYQVSTKNTEPLKAIQAYA